MSSPSGSDNPSPSAGPQKFGAFAGVFVPTVLTILGVIMYLRLGWVVGNAGILGGLLIVLLAFAITLATGMAMASFATNIRIGAGGAYSIISQSLGLEVGGSVGLPLYLAQALVIALYIFGFREGVMFVVPADPEVTNFFLIFLFDIVGIELLIDLAAFFAIVTTAWISAKFAFRIQYVILGIVALSLVSVGIAAVTGSMQYDLGDIQLWGTFPGEPPAFDGASFWVVFAVFFPAATGIMAGLNMSGELKDPRKALPLGTLSAVGVCLVIYCLLAIWIAASATTEELVTNYTIMLDKAWYGEFFVLAGLLGATFSSGLASMVGAPRILQALGDHHILPRSEWLATRRDDGEPQNAVFVTAAIVFAGLLMRDLNAIAPLITMFFLITYMMINVVVFFEQSLDLLSFRPLFRVPRIVPLVGLVGCLFAMFIINPVLSLIALVLVGAAYVLMARRQLDAPYGDVRSGMFVSIAEWAAKRVWDLPAMQERAWKPNLLVAVDDEDQLRGSFLFIRDLARPKGSVKLVGIDDDLDSSPLPDQLEELSGDFRDRDVFANWIAIEADGLTEGLLSAIQAARGAFPRPNTVFMQMPERLSEPLNYTQITNRADDQNMGVVLFAPHPTARLGQRRQINVWVRDRTPDWGISMDIGNLDLALLLTYKLGKNWGADLRFLMAVEDADQLEAARQFAEELLTLARIPNMEIVVEHQPFDQFVSQAPRADLNIFGISRDPNPEFARDMVEATDAACLFVQDSGTESALA